MLSDTNPDTKRKRRGAGQEDERPALVLGIDRNDPTELKLSILKGDKWELLKEDTFAIVSARLRDALYEFAYLDKHR